MRHDLSSNWKISQDRVAINTFVAGFLFLAANVFLAFRDASGDDNKSPQFERDVAPILTAHCFKCHGGESRQAELDVRSIPLLLRGGESGPAIVPGSAAKSALHQRIKERSMPPNKELPLTDQQISLIGRWLDRGATSEAADHERRPAVSFVTDADRQFWAFRKLKRSPAPTPRPIQASRNAVDAFLLERLQQKGLSFSAEADRWSLVRPACLDVTGIPPTPEEAAEFVDDRRPDAFDRLVDRLLVSPRFGERWTRHWLDIVGYTDTSGDDTDVAITKLANGKWKYRDYVVRAFNGNKPFDRFLVEQFAGDELFDWRSATAYTEEQRDCLIATGFLRTSADETQQNELNTADIRHAVLQRSMEVAMGGVLGLTIACARCHSHKYDPIPQEDYYRLLAAFTPAYNPQAWIQPGPREISDVPPAEKKRRETENARLNAEIASLSARQKVIRSSATTADLRAELATLQTKIARLSGRRSTSGTIQAIYDVGPAPPTYVLQRGNHETPGKAVAPGYLRVLCEGEQDAFMRANAPYPGASGRRLALARWLTDRKTAAGALTARVFVNRVWQQLFGQGCVATSENLGRSGTPPTHRELLDWLAVEFTEGGWRVKPLIRKLMTSAAYRQSAAIPTSLGSIPDPIAKAIAADPFNTLLWRMPLRPLEAEAIHDGMLAVCGRLDSAMGGEPLACSPQPDGLVRVNPGGRKKSASPMRRMLYVLQRHRYHLSLAETFDQPEMVGLCFRRVHAPVVGQSLTLLNDAFVVEVSESFAARVVKEAATQEPTSRIDRAFRLALCRPPRPAEREWAAGLIARQALRFQSEGQHDSDRRALAHVCQMLMNSNEFLYAP